MVLHIPIVIEVSDKQLPDLTLSQQERQMYIDMRLRFLGEVRRQDLVSRFGIETAAATRDLMFYREKMPDNLELVSRTKAYQCTEQFVPMFPVSAEDALRWLSQRPDQTGSFDNKIPLPVEIPFVHSFVNVDILSTISRAIKAGRVLKIQYRSITSGMTSREIAPHSLADTGDRWHTRAYDRKTGAFREFALARVQSAELINGFPHDNEKPGQDTQWNSDVTVELIPHPDNVPHPKSLKDEYRLPQAGGLRVKTRAALICYLLRRMSVDCSEGHRLKGPSYIWCLKDRRAIYGLPNLDLAPGFLSKTS